MTHVVGDDRRRDLRADRTTERAGEIWRKTLEEYEQPVIDPAIDEQLREFVVRRRTELGD